MTQSTDRLAAALADRYTIERELGQGGMATVYLAHDIKHDRKVALKVLKPELAAVLGAERFVQEIKTTAALQHPHILPLFDSGQAGGFLYYVMPYIEGETLRSKLDREKQLGIEEAVRITTDVADALDYAHRHGVIHRDIKPENILLHDGRPMLADFGIALAVKEAGGNRLTETGLSLGTPQYMSPEQATGDRQLDARSDVYSLGAVLYEMLAGEPPVTGPNAQAMIAKLLTERPTRLQVVRDTVTGGIDAAVAKALAKTPADRFPGAAEFARALAAPGAGGGGAIAPVSHGRLRLLIGAAVVLAVAAVGGYVGLRRPAAPARSRAARTQLTNSGRAYAAYLSPDGAFVLYLERRQCPNGPRCPYDVVIQETAESGARRVLATIANATLGGWNPDSRRFLLGRNEGGRERVSVVSVLGSEELRDVGGQAAWTPFPDTMLTWTNAKSRQAWLRVARASDATAVDSIPVPGASDIQNAWMAPDGRWFAVTYTDSGVFTTPAPAIVSRHGMLIDSMPGGGRILGWSASSRAVYLARERGDRIEVVRQAINQRTGRRAGLPVVVTRVASLTASLTGTTLAIAERGPVQTEIWAIERPRIGAGWTAHRVYQSTSQISADISRDGATIRPHEWKVVNDTTVPRWLEEPFAGGTPVPSNVAPRIVDAMSTNVNDSETAVVVAERRGGRTMLTRLAYPSGAVVAEIGAAPTDSGWVWLLPNDRYLWLPQAGHEFDVLDAQAAVVRRIVWPDSLGSSGADLSADRTALVVLAQRTVSGIARLDAYRLSLSDGTITHIAPLSNDIDWGCGWIGDAYHLTRTDSVTGVHTIRVPTSGGRIVDEGPLPIQGEFVSLRGSANGLRGIEVVYSVSRDIVLLRNFDPNEP
jgi:tRNA A-37 threonylcarbamoyl transferase component Bud32